MTEKERFPGEREPDTAMTTQPGILGTTGFGGDLPPDGGDATVNEAFAREKEREGGGREVKEQRSKVKGQRLGRG